VLEGNRGGAVWGCLLLSATALDVRGFLAPSGLVFSDVSSIDRFSGLCIETSCFFPWAISLLLRLLLFLLLVSPVSSTLLPSAFLYVLCLSFNQS